MKRGIILLFGLLLMNQGNINCTETASELNGTTMDSIKILSTPDLYNLSIKWSDEYSKEFHGKAVKVVSISDKKMADQLIAEGNLAFVSNEYYSGFDNQTLWKVVVGRDVIVPVINSRNPVLNEILKQGISQISLTNLLKNPDSQKWGTLVKNSQNKAINVYLIDDESIKSALAEYLNTDPVNIHGIKVTDSKEMVAAIQKDPFAIGFCKMINVLDFRNQTIVENIRLLPIDRNSNGTIDYNENIYDDFNVFARGVWIGKYPKALYSNIFSVSSAQPKNESAVLFLKWVLSDGQQYLYNSGFSDLLLSERQTTIDKLYSSKIYTGSTADNNTLPKTALIILVSIIVLGLVVDAVIRFARHKNTVVQITNSDSHSILNENSVLIPKGLYFDKTHTWAFMEQNGIVKVGVDDFMQHVTGAITRIKMKSPGKKVKKGEQILSIIQNGKQLNLYAPVSGTIIEQNKLLDTDTSIINTSPYTEGWVYKIEPDNWHRENQLLFMAEKQKQHIKDELSRLKDFLGLVLNANTEKYSTVVLQDGGELKDGILSNMGPEVWEEFQIKFIDPSKKLWFYEII
jgi:glycine cleavage system H lipoate-binding protein/ABC-type phosphate transport system substrate-binding protein